MMYILGIDVVASLEQFSVLCEDEKEMQEMFRLASQTDEIKIMTMNALPTTVKANEYIKQLKDLNKPDDLFFGKHEEIKEDNDD